MEFNLPLWDPVTVNKGSRTESWESKGTVSMHAERLLYHGVKPREILERVAIHVAVVGKVCANLLLELVQLRWVREQKVDARGEKIAVGVESSNDQMVSLGEQKVLRGLFFVVHHQREVVGVCELVPACHTVTNDSAVLSQNGWNDGREAGRQREENQGSQERKSPHNLVQSAPGADAAKNTEEEVALACKFGLIKIHPWGEVSG